MDQTEMGTNDFRGVKFNVREASLMTQGGAGVRVRANEDVHVRACLAGDRVLLHVLSECGITPVMLKKGDRVVGRCSLSLVGGGG